MTTTQHPYANILRAIADGEEIEWQRSNGCWEYQGLDQTFAEIASNAYSPDRYRVKPKTITINGFEVPEPLREMPPDGTQVFWPVLVSASGKNIDHCASYHYSEMVKTLISQGLLHLTADAASAHALALISLTKNKSK